MWKVLNKECETRFTPSGRKLIYWLCECSGCGLAHPVLSENIIRKLTDLCRKCSSRKRTADLKAGDVLKEKYKIISFVGRRKYFNSVHFLYCVECLVCGHQFEMDKQSLKKSSVKHKCFCLSKEKAFGDLSPLLDYLKDKYSSYWLGFLLADGHFSKLNRLKLSLAIKDEEHLRKFANFISFSGKLHYVKKNGVDIAIGVSVLDSMVVAKLKNDLGIMSTKSHNPCELDKLFENTEAFIPFVIGFIDGDGCIKKQSGTRKDCSISFHMHSSWMEMLQRISDKLAELTGTRASTAKIGKDGYSRLNICNCLVVEYLKRRVDELALPVLQRKWSKIVLSDKHKYKDAETRRKTFSELRNLGMEHKSIAEEMGLGLTTVKRIACEVNSGVTNKFIK